MRNIVNETFYMVTYAVLTGVLATLTVYGAIQVCNFAYYLNKSINKK